MGCQAQVCSSEPAEDDSGLGEETAVPERAGLRMRWGFAQRGLHQLGLVSFPGCKGVIYFSNFITVFSLSVSATVPISFANGRVRICEFIFQQRDEA